MGTLGATLRALYAHRWQLPVLLLVMGAVLRLAWALPMLSQSYADGEIPNAAIAFARTGTIADAFQPGQGPTAHVLPVPVIYAGLVYRVLGVQSPAAELVLVVAAVGAVVGSFGLLYLCFGIMGTDRRMRLLALALLCLVPVNLVVEVAYFRIWEGGISVALGSAFLYALLRLEQRPDVGWRPVTAMALLAALIFFINPVVGVGVYVCALVFLVDRLPARRWPGAALIAALALVLVIGPWALRNQAVMGQPILLRSNFGLELALGNHPAAVNAADPRQVFRERLVEIHPFASKSAYAAMQAEGGEIAYANALGDEAKAWISANPKDFARLTARHVTELYFPPSWQWNIYAGNENAGVGESRFIGLMAAAGLAGALWAAVAAWRRYRFAVIMLLMPALPYAIVQPVLRYRYVIFALTVYFAADLAGRLLARTRWAMPVPATR